MQAQLTQKLNPAQLFGERRFLMRFNDTARDYPRDKCLHELFEAQVERTPDAVAVVHEAQQLTYAQLNTRANQLAHFLLNQWRELQFASAGSSQTEVCATPLVGICVERSLEMVIGLLGILKAGGAYVPIDPAYPRERLSFMLTDANVFVLLTQANLLDALPPHKGSIICLDSDWDLIAKEPEENPTSGATAENLAYVIYTSGSTGKPKGAMIRHRGLVNYLSWCTEAYKVDRGCGALVHSSISFDLTITSLFSPLLVGRSVFLVPDGIEALAEALLVRDNYSLVKITPAHLRVLTELLPAQKIAGHVRALIIGGEALHMESLSFWRNHSPETRLINEYGPTETVVGCCVYEVRPFDATSGPVPIGCPIANTELYVLDENLHPVGAGAVGELYIGGDGVARGYLNRSRLTKERFIPDPFSHDSSTRLYRTGDLARFLPGGDLEYLGRVDNQVKIKGYRIELGEIETVLQQHRAVSECVVVASDEPSGEKRLVAYVAGDQQESSTVNELSDFLRARLPDYMIPTAFVRMDSLPLTENGKIDRKALLTTSVRPANSPDVEAARTPLEQTLTTIWVDVFKLDGISINDNFFDLGGDSILGTLILARAAQAGLKLSPKQLFEHQTIAALSRVIS